MKPCSHIINNIYVFKKLYSRIFGTQVFEVGLFENINVIDYIWKRLHLVYFSFFFQNKTTLKRSIWTWPRNMRCLFVEANLEKPIVLKISYFNKESFVWHKILTERVSWHVLLSQHNSTWSWHLIVLHDFSVVSRILS